MLHILKTKHQNVFSFSVDIKALYETAIKNQNLYHDHKQLEVVNCLQTLNDNLEKTHHKWKNFANSLNFTEPPKYTDQVTAAKSESQKKQNKKHFFSLFSKEFSTFNPHAVRVPGLYLYGGSGCGKTFLSDIFFDNLKIQQKKRIHFHEFMASVHMELFELQKQKKAFDPLIAVARKTARQTRLLYLDEFQVTDVADASILKRLFEQLISNELVLLATSNRHPNQLYKNGHQRQFFVPFIHYLQQHCSIHHLDSNKDYRYELEIDRSDTTMSYLHPINDLSEKKLMKIASLLVGQSKPEFKQVVLEPIPGRTLKISQSCKDVCIFDFNDLVEKVMGDADFRVICKNYKAIVIKNMRQIQRNERDMANRMIKLFDEAYFRKVKLYINGATDLDDIIQALPERYCRNEEDFAMTRCKSRLMEFQTKKYKETLSYVELKRQGQITHEREGPMDIQQNRKSKTTQQQQD